MSRRGLIAQKTELRGNEEYIVGRNSIAESLKAGRTFKKILFENSLQASKDTRINDIISSAKLRNISCGFVSKDIVQKIEREVGITSEGVVGIVEKLEDMQFEDILALCKRKNKEPFIIIINNILYEENLGAILRTAAAGGVDAVILPKRDKRSITPTVRRISMGGSEYVPLIKDNLFEVLDRIRNEGIKIVGVELTGKDYYFDEDLTGPIAIVLGGEDAGISEPLQKRCDSIVKIPMLPTVQSLNVSVSTGVIIYEKIRQECQR